MATEYPIILVHGVGLKSFLCFRAFGRIEDILRNEGHTVHVSRTDGFGRISDNAAFLKQEILTLMEKTGARKVNIIAHSKGGLDSKYMICELGMEKAVASLTTLCTPYRGSVIAGRILNLPRWMLRFASFWVDFWYRLFGDKRPCSYEVCRELSRVESIEDETTDLEGVYCQSFSTTLEKSRDDFVMGIPLYFSRRFGDTVSDGLVAPESTRFGNYRGDCTDESVSHSEMAGFMIKRNKREKVYDFYIALAKELEEMNF